MSELLKSCHSNLGSSTLGRFAFCRPISIEQNRGTLYAWRSSVTAGTCIALGAILVLQAHIVPSYSGS